MGHSFHCIPFERGHRAANVHSIASVQASNACGHGVQQHACILGGRGDEQHEMASPKWRGFDARLATRMPQLRLDTS